MGKFRAFSGGKGLPKTKKIDGKVFGLHSVYIRKDGEIQKEKKRWKNEGYNVRIVKSPNKSYGLYWRKRRK